MWIIFDWFYLPEFLAYWQYLSFFSNIDWLRVVFLLISCAFTSEDANSKHNEWKKKKQQSQCKITKHFPITIALNTIAMKKCIFIIQYFVSFHRYIYENINSPWSWMTDVEQQNERTNECKMTIWKISNRIIKYP